MSLPFLEERISFCVRYGSSYTDDYNVEITRVSSKQEYRRLVDPYPERRFLVSYVKDNSDLWNSVVSLYHRAYGKYAGFRVHALDDNSTNGQTGTPTATDQELSLVSTGIYQLQKEYGLDGTAIAIGRPVRIIYKPVSGSVLIAISNSTSGDFATTDFTVDTTTGQVTLAEDKTRAITSISQAAQAVVGVGSGHTFVTGDTVHFSDVVGMTEINGMRGEILSTTASSITVDINTIAFTAYSSGGNVHTRPQSGESVKGGCLFDIPVRFDSVLDTTPVSPEYTETGEIALVELIQP